MEYSLQICCMGEDIKVTEKGSVVFQKSSHLLPVNENFGVFLYEIVYDTLNTLQRWKACVS